MQREDSLHALVIDNSPHREAFVYPSAFTRNYRTSEYLGADLIALLDTAMNINNIADLEKRYLFLQAFAFNGIQYLRFHWYISFANSYLARNMFFKVKTGLYTLLPKEQALFSKVTIFRLFRFYSKIAAVPLSCGIVSQPR